MGCLMTKPSERIQKLRKENFFVNEELAFLLNAVIDFLDEEYEKNSLQRSATDQPLKDG